MYLIRFYDVDEEELAEIQEKFIIVDFYEDDDGYYENRVIVETASLGRRFSDDFYAFKDEEVALPLTYENKDLRMTPEQAEKHLDLFPFDKVYVGGIVNGLEYDCWVSKKEKFILEEQK